jgi:ribosomal protein S18 acetylase RimI-like enzyme
LRRLMDEAAVSRQPVTLSVYLFNPAIRLYERLGFSKVAEDGVYIQMRWADSTA